MLLSVRRLVSAHLLLPRPSEKLETLPLIVPNSDRSAPSALNLNIVLYYCTL